MAVERTYLYPVWVRIWHWINALSFIILVITGIRLHFITRGSGGIPFETAVTLHNISAVILTIGYVFYLLGNLISGNGLYYRGVIEDARHNLWKQARYYISGMFRNEAHPFAINKERKFNPLQKISYVAVMYICMPLIIISGLGLLFPETIIGRVFNISGLALTAYLHQIVGFVLTLFLLVHLYTCTLGDKPNTLFKSMIDGYHEETHP